MKQPEYIEGTKAIENFEAMAVAIFKVPKAEVAKAERKKLKARPSSQKTERKSDRD
jgi:hypothetical protein